VAADAGGALVFLVGSAVLRAVSLLLVLSHLGLYLPGPLLEIALAGMVITTAFNALNPVLRGQEWHLRFG
jgi:hypothetical protein